jgi:hypothetical protein
MPLELALEVDKAVKAVCPIHGVSIGVVGDKNTWRIDFKPEATTQERTDAQTVVTNFDTGIIQAEATREAGLDAAIDGDTTIQQLKAMTNAEFNTWWDANVTTAAQAIAVLKRLARVIIRRVL